MRTKLFCLPHRVALVAATALVAVSTAASAQSGTYAFDIPAQPLSQALKVFARTTGQQIIFNDYVNTTMAALFMTLVLAMLCFSIAAIVRALAAPDVTTREASVVPAE